MYGYCLLSPCEAILGRRKYRKREDKNTDVTLVTFQLVEIDVGILLPFDAVGGTFNNFDLQIVVTAPIGVGASNVRNIVTCKLPLI